MRPELTQRVISNEVRDLDFQDEISRPGGLEMTLLAECHPESAGGGRGISQTRLLLRQSTLADRNDAGRGRVVE